MKLTSEQLIQIEGQTYYLRLLSIFFIVALVFWFYKSAASAGPMSLAILGGLVYTVVSHYVVVRRIFHRFLVNAMMVLDWLFCLSVVYFTDVAGVGFLLFPLVVIYHGMYLGYLGSLFSATVFALASLWLALSAGDPQALSVVAFRIPLLYLVGMFTGYLSQQRMRERDARLDLQEALRAEHKARDFMSAARELRGDSSAMLLSIAAMVTAATESAQTIIFLKNTTGEYLEARGSFPQATEKGLNLANAVQEPLRGHWIDRPGAECEAVTFEGAGLPSWASSVPGGKLVGVRLAVHDSTVGAMYCIPARSQASGDLAEAAKRIAPQAALALKDAEDYIDVERKADELLNGLHRAVDRMGKVREMKDRAALSLGGLDMDPARMKATLDRQVLSLSANEFEVLYLLAKHPGQTVNQSMLLKEVWGDTVEPKSNLVDVCIHRLRRKLGEKPGGKGRIATSRGAGYMFLEERRQPPGAKI